jgi:hypothetical protein
MGNQSFYMKLDISACPWPNLYSSRHNIIVLQKNIFEILLPVGMGLLLASDKVNQELIAVGQLFDVNQLPTSAKAYPSYFSR